MQAITTKAVQDFALAELKLAQKAFNKNPISLHWYTLTRAMMTHQQAQQLTKDMTAQGLLDRLAGLPVGQWPEAIVQHTTGMRIDQALA